MRAYLSSLRLLGAVVLCCVTGSGCGIGAAIAQAPVVDECCLQLCFGDDWQARRSSIFCALRELAACKTLGMKQPSKLLRVACNPGTVETHQ